MTQKLEAYQNLDKPRLIANVNWLYKELVNALELEVVFLLMTVAHHVLYQELHLRHSLAEKLTMTTPQMCCQTQNITTIEMNLAVEEVVTLVEVEEEVVVEVCPLAAQIRIVELVLL
jgi:hypothetical protein